LKKFDVAIVGAGPAGSTAALLLAEADLNVLVVERASTPGSKNVSGGLIYTDIFNQVYPRFWEEAPVERAIDGHSLVLLGEDASVSLDFKGRAESRSRDVTCNAYSVLRADFDPWIANKAKEAGAMLMTRFTVDSLLVEDGAVKGIRVGPDEVTADVVIDAEGSQGLLLREAGLREEPEADEVSLGVKEVIRLSEETINERFRCPSGEGAAMTLVGHTGGVEGGGFLYTNRESLSLGVVVKIDALYKSDLQPHEVLDVFKSHPFIAALIDNGEVVEYSAETIHRGGLAAIPPLYGNGYLAVGSAACLVLNNILTLRGMDTALASAEAAAQAVVEAKRRGDYTAASLSVYEDYWQETSAYQDMKTFNSVYPLLANERFFDLYPQLACDVVEDLFAVRTEPSQKVLGILREKMSGRVSPWRAVRDLWALARGLIV
jgi:electron transfer flavoprotein-quinone oxidoreductase